MTRGVRAETKWSKMKETQQRVLSYRMAHRSARPHIEIENGWDHASEQMQPGFPAYLNAFINAFAD